MWFLMRKVPRIFPRVDKKHNSHLPFPRGICGVVVRRLTSESPVTREMSFPERTSLFFPPEHAAFKVERNFQEMRPPNTQNAVKIVPRILPIICDECNLRADCFLA
jgi:hypothetical protein